MCKEFGVKCLKKYCWSSQFMSEHFSFQGYHSRLYCFGTNTLMKQNWAAENYLIEGFKCSSCQFQFGFESFKLEEVPDLGVCLAMSLCSCVWNSSASGHEIIYGYVENMIPSLAKRARALYGLGTNGFPSFGLGRDGAKFPFFRIHLGSTSNSKTFSPPDTHRGKSWGRDWIRQTLLHIFRSFSTGTFNLI